MVEANISSGPAEEQKEMTFPESVNVPLMASLNLSSIFNDPELGKNYQTKQAVKEQNEYSTGLWGDGKIKTLDDLELEMADDLSDEEREGSDNSDQDDDPTT